MAEALGGARAAGEAAGSRVIEFPGILPDFLEFGPGTFDPLPPRTIDQFGHIPSPAGFLIGWRVSGPFAVSFDLLAGNSLLVDADDLPSGDYWLLFSHAELGTRIDMLLPAGAVSDGSPSIESVQGGPQPEPPTIVFNSTPNGLRLAWPVSEFNHALESRSTLGSTDEWLPLDSPPQSDGESYEVMVPPSPDNAFFRLRWITDP